MTTFDGEKASPELQQRLVEAAGRGDAREVRRLLRLGATANCRVLQGEEPLPIVQWVFFEWREVRNRDQRFADFAEVIRTLVQAGAPVDDRCSLGNTALMQAALHGEVRWIRLLLQLGADPNATNYHYRETPLTAASHLGHPDAVRELLQSGANVNQPTEDGFTPLMYAAISRVARSVYYLLEAGADADFVHPQEGFSALTLGVGWGLGVHALVAIARRMRHPAIRRQQITKAIEEAQRHRRWEVARRLQELLKHGS